MTDKTKIPFSEKRKLEKRKKVQKKIKRQVKNSDFDINLDWSQLKDLLGLVINGLGNYNDIMPLAHRVATDEDANLTTEEKLTLARGANELYTSIASLNSEITAAFGPYRDRSGKVDQDDVPLFYSLYDQVVDIQGRHSEVLAAKADQLTQLIDKGTKGPKEEEK